MALREGISTPTQTAIADFFEDRAELLSKHIGTIYGAEAYEHVEDLMLAIQQTYFLPPISHINADTRETAYDLVTKAFTVLQTSTEKTK